MSTTTAAGPARPVADKYLFARLLRERYEQADEHQGDVAEWLNSYMDDHDLDVELVKIERAAVKKLQRATDEHAKLRERLRRLMEAAAEADEDEEESERQRRRAEIIALDPRVQAAQERRDELARETSVTMDAIAVIRHYRASNAQSGDYHAGQSAVSKWKNGKSGPTPEKWLAVAEYMGLSLAEVHRLIEAAQMPESIPALRQQLARAAKENRDLRSDLERVRDELRRYERTQRELDEELVVLRTVARAIEETPVSVS